MNDFFSIMGGNGTDRMSRMSQEDYYNNLKIAGQQMQSHAYQNISGVLNTSNDKKELDSAEKLLLLIED